MTTHSTEEISHAIETDPESLIVEIVTSIATELGVRPCELPPLNDYVDVDALVRLVETAVRDDAQHVTTQFRYDGHAVRVRSDASVDIGPLFSGSAAEGGLDD